MDVSGTAEVVVADVLDLRSTPLARLASSAVPSGESLRHALPPDSRGSVSVAAFGSSI